MVDSVVDVMLVEIDSDFKLKLAQADFGSSVFVLNALFGDFSFLIIRGFDFTFLLGLFRFVVLLVVVVVVAGVVVVVSVAIVVVVVGGGVSTDELIGDTGSTISRNIGTSFNAEKSKDSYRNVDAKD